MIPEFKDYFKLHLIVFIWGFTAILNLYISIPAVELTFFRALVSFIALGILLYWQGKRILLPRAALIKISLTGALIAIHWILFFLAARVSNASACLAGIATGSLWTSILEPIFTKKRLRYYEIFLGILVILGLTVISSFSMKYIQGLMLGVISAFFGASFSVANSILVKKYEPSSITFYEMFGACVFTLAFFPFYATFFSDYPTLQLNPNFTDWIYIGILAIVCTVYAYNVSVRLMKKFSAFTINLTVNLEPVYGIILASSFRDEKMSNGFYIGTCIILLAVFIHPILAKMYKDKPEIPLETAKPYEALANK